LARDFKSKQLKKLERDLVGKIPFTTIIPLFTNFHFIHSLRKQLLLVGNSGGSFKMWHQWAKCAKLYWFALANAKKNRFGTYAINNHWLM
jgi:hypothetical protein